MVEIVACTRRGCTQRIGEEWVLGLRLGLRRKRGCNPGPARGRIAVIKQLSRPVILSERITGTAEVADVDRLDFRHRIAGKGKRSHMDWRRTDAGPTESIHQGDIVCRNGVDHSGPAKIVEGVIS